MAEAVCIIVENLSVPADRRVWREAKALSEAGYRVSVICPKGHGFEKGYETLEGVEIYRYPAWEGSTLLGYLLEYASAADGRVLVGPEDLCTARLRILQACNPPDTIFLIALFFKLFGVQFVFDQHDPTPEFCAVKFQRRGLACRLARLAEWLSFRVADVAIATNEALREIALTRGGVSAGTQFRGSNQPRPE